MSDREPTSLFDDLFALSGPPPKDSPPKKQKRILRWVFRKK